MATSLADIMKQAEEVMSGLSNAKQVVTESTKESVASSERSRKILEAVATNAAAIETQKGQAALQVQKLNHQTLLKAGEDPEGTFSRLNENLARLTQAQDRTMATSKEVADLRSVPLSDGVFNFIGSQFKAALKENGLEAQAKDMQAIQSSVVGINNALQETFQTNQAKATVVTQATIEAGAQNAAAQALLAAEKERIAGISMNSQGVLKVAEMSLQQLSVLQAKQAAEFAAEDQQMQRAGEARAQRAEVRAEEEFDFRKQMQTLQLQQAKKETADQEEAKRMEAATLASVNKGRAARGFAPLSAEEAFYATKQMRTGQVGAEFQADWQRGMLISSKGDTQAIATSPGKAVLQLEQFQFIVPKTQERTKAILEEAANQLRSKATPQQLKDESWVVGNLNKNVAEQVAIQQRSIVPGSDNPFEIGDLKSFLTMPAIQGLPLGRLLSKASVAGVELSDPNKVIDLVRAKVKAGEITSSQAATLSDVYRVANAAHLQTANFAGYGIKVDPLIYNAKISGQGSKPVNILDPQAITRIIMAPPGSPFTRTSSPFLN